MQQKQEQTKLDTSGKIQWLLLVLLAAMLFLGFFLPIKDDEIDWGYANHRAIADKGSLTTLLPQCLTADTYAKPLPLSWYPYAYVNDLIFMHVDSLIWLRLVGMARFLILLAAGAWVLKALTPQLGLATRYACMLGLALILLDITALSLQMLRPEQTLGIGVAVLLGIVLHAKTISQSRLHTFLALLLFCMTVLTVVPAHPKTVALVPFFLTCTWLFLRNLKCSKAVSLLATGAVAVFCVQAALFALNRYECSSSPVTLEVIEAHSIPLHLLREDIVEFIKQLFVIFALAIVCDFALPITAGWLPFSLASLPGQDIAVILPLVAGPIIRIGIFSYCCLRMVRHCYSLLRSGKCGNVGNAELNWLGSTILFAMIACMLLVGVRRPFYLRNFEMPMLYLSMFLYIAANGASLQLNTKWQTALKVLCILAAMNAALLLLRFYPYITQPETRESSVVTQDLARTNMYSLFNYNEQRQEVLRAYEECGLPPVSEARHLVLDTFTYPVLKQSYQPFELFYLADINSGKPIEAEVFSERLAEYHSDGVLARCTQVPKRYLKLGFTRHNEYCCLKLSK